MKALLRALALAAALSAGGAAEAAEEILAFDSAIEVLPGGDLDVTETIRVTVEGDAIRRGIYRDFPIRHQEEDGQISLVGFEVIGVSRNGAPEPYAVSRQGDYARVLIGRADEFLPAPSEQVYEIRYRTGGQLRAHDGFDELYWNVTGDLWSFPIRAASVAIHLPTPAPILQHAAYTGPRGARGEEFEVMEAAEGRFRARTTATLAPGEGFTVAVAWPPGVVEVPPVRYDASAAREPPMMLGGIRLAPLVAVWGSLAGAFALFVAWLRVGRDPPASVVYPQFEPPEGLSPAAMRYVARWGFDPRCLTAAIIDMAVKGALRIVERPAAGLFRDREYVLEPLGAQGRGLSVGEASAYGQLFPTGAPLTLTAGRTSGVRMDRARAELRSKLWDEHYGASFRRNGLHTLAGVAVGLAATLPALGYVERWNVLSLVQWAAPALLAGLLVHAAGFLWFEIEDLRHGGRLLRRRLAKLLPFGVMAAILAVQTAPLGGPGALLGLLDPVIAAAGAAFGAAAAAFHFLMAAPTKAGRRLMDEIEGFRLYMRTAEEDRLDILNPPERTPERFERLLPYAVALGLSHEWAAKFAGVLAAAGAPAWYAGEGRFDIDTLDREFSHAVASTTTPPSRGSSGSGGGGSSGGGGGGGGGGGW